MGFDTKKLQGPGEIMRLEIPLTLSIVLIVAVTVLTVSYALWADARSTIYFLGAATGVASGVLAAFYIGRGLKITIEQRDYALTDQRISRAFAFLTRWNDPNFADLRKKWRALLEELEGKTDDQIYETIRASLENRTVIADVLNFFEEMAYAARGGVADLATLKQICGTIVVRYFEAIRPWLARYRTDKINRLLMSTSSGSVASGSDPKDHQYLDSPSSHLPTTPPLFDADTNARESRLQEYFSPMVPSS